MDHNTSNRKWILNPEEIHVWLAELNGVSLHIADYGSLLAPDEQARAARFYFQKDREHYTLTRGILRELLGGYLGIAPREVRMCYNEYGKPALASNQKRNLEFNVSHSHGLALYGFTLARCIGVDVEKIRIEIETEQLANRFFAPAEVAALNSFPQELRCKAFFNGWARKEAFIKARGMGLSLPLDQFAVSLTDGSPALLSIGDDKEAAESWTIRDVPCPANFVAAIAVEGVIRELTFRDFPLTR